MASKRGNPPVKGDSRKAAKPPRRLNGAMSGKRNRELNTQTRRVLGRHYAAKYRVR